MKHPIYLIAAADEKNGIGIKGKLPWRLPGDLKFFQKTTEETKDPTKINLVIMGRTTWESIPEQYRPLPGRHNLVLSRNKKFEAPGARVVASLDEALALADESIETVFIIGGAKVFEETIKDERITGIYLTRVHGVFDCDTFFPAIPAKFTQKMLGAGEDGDVKYTFELYTA
jgi:dihydrofolate reductase